MYICVYLSFPDETFKWNLHSLSPKPDLFSHRDPWATGQTVISVSHWIRVQVSVLRLVLWNALLLLSPQSANDPRAVRITLVLLYPSQTHTDLIVLPLLPLCLVPLFFSDGQSDQCSPVCKSSPQHLLESQSPTQLSKLVVFFFFSLVTWWWRTA